MQGPSLFTVSVRPDDPPNVLYLSTILFFRPEKTPKGMGRMSLGDGSVAPTRRNRELICGPFKPLGSTRRVRMEGCSHPPVLSAVPSKTRDRFGSGRDVTRVRDDPCAKESVYSIENRIRGNSKTRVNPKTAKMVPRLLCSCRVPRDPGTLTYINDVNISKDWN